jgi:DNA-binding NarL/FixJ family response regulator
MAYPVDPSAPLRQTAVDPTRGPLRLAILDDHQLLVESLRLFFNRVPGMTVVGTANTCAEAFELLTLTRPDVLLLDVDLPDADGLERLPALQAACPATRFIVLTALANEAALLRAVEAGASGFVGKHQPAAELLGAVQLVAAGEMAMPAALLVGLLGRRRAPAAPPPHQPLTPREREVLALAAEGQSSADIAGSLSLSVLTVRTHLRNAIGKLNAHSRLEAVATALRTGLLAPPS